MTVGSLAVVQDADDLASLLVHTVDHLQATRGYTRLESEYLEEGGVVGVTYSSPQQGRE